MEGLAPARPRTIGQARLSVSLHINKYPAACRGVLYFSRFRTPFGNEEGSRRGLRDDPAQGLRRLP
jgi:hypothetical protein